MPEKAIPVALNDFVKKYNAQLLPYTVYYTDSEATQYPELASFKLPTQEGLTFKRGRFGLTNAERVNRYEVVELVNILQDCNVELTSLLLFGGLIDDQGMYALAEFLKTTTTLKVLDLHYSRISEKGMQYLIDALKINTSLTHINIRSNALTEGLFNNLKELFTSYNFNIRQICIVQRTSFPGDWKPSIAEEKSLHDLIIQNALAEKKTARQLVCGFVNEPAFKWLPTDIRFAIARFSMFARLPYLEGEKATNLLNKAVEDFNNRPK